SIPRPADTSTSGAEPIDVLAHRPRDAAKGRTVEGVADIGALEIGFDTDDERRTKCALPIVADLTAAKSAGGVRAARDVAIAVLEIGVGDIAVVCRPTIAAVAADI